MFQNLGVWVRLMRKWCRRTSSPRIGWSTRRRKTFGSVYFGVLYFQPVDFSFGLVEGKRVYVRRLENGLGICMKLKK